MITKYGIAAKDVRGNVACILSLRPLNKLPNKLGHLTSELFFFFFLIRSWNFDLEQDGGVILAHRGRRSMKFGATPGMFRT